MTKQDARQLIMYAAMDSKTCDVCPAKAECKQTLHACYKQIRKAARVLDGDGE